MSVGMITAQLTASPSSLYVRGFAKHKRAATRFSFGEAGRFVVFGPFSF